MKFVRSLRANESYFVHRSAQDSQPLIGDFEASNLLMNPPVIDGDLQPVRQENWSCTIFVKKGDSKMYTVTVTLTTDIPESRFSKDLASAAASGAGGAVQVGAIGGVLGAQAGLGAVPEFLATPLTNAAMYQSVLPWEVAVPVAAGAVAGAGLGAALKGGGPALRAVSPPIKRRVMGSSPFQINVAIDGRKVWDPPHQLPFTKSDVDSVRLLITHPQRDDRIQEISNDMATGTVNAINKRQQSGGLLHRLRGLWQGNRTGGSGSSSSSSSSANGASSSAPDIEAPSPTNTSGGSAAPPQPPPQPPPQQELQSSRSQRSRRASASRTASAPKQQRAGGPIRARSQDAPSARPKRGKKNPY